MIYTNKEYCLEVKGSMACFTRPEMKVERVSYDIITPSAARAIFESIFWKPAIQWNITRIEVLNPIRWFSMKRNEIGSLMSPRSSGLFIEDNRQQKSSLLLKDVCYRVFAELEFIPIRNRAKEDMLKVPSKSSDENPGKYNAMFERRAKNIIRKTKCFDFWERNVLFPKTKRSFFRTPKHPLPCPFPLNFSLLIITKKFGNLAKNRYICIV